MRFDFRYSHTKKKKKKKKKSVLVDDVPINVELVEEDGPVSVMGSGIADLRPMVVHSSPVQCGPRVSNQHPDFAPHSLI